MSRKLALAEPPLLVRPSERVYRRAFPGGPLTAHERADRELGRTRCGKYYQPGAKPAPKEVTRGYCVMCAAA